MDFLDILDKLLRKKGVSATRMSLDLGLSKDAVFNWRKRGTVPSGDALDKIADYFNVSVDYLLGRTDNPAPIEEVFALSSDTDYDDLPPEAVEEIERFKEFVRSKYKKK